jgi:hypothetical protein
MSSPAPHELQDHLADQWRRVERKAELRRVALGDPPPATPPFFTRRTPDGPRGRNSRAQKVRAMSMREANRRVKNHQHLEEQQQPGAPADGAAAAAATAAARPPVARAAARPTAHAFLDMARVAAGLPPRSPGSAAFPPMHGGGRGIMSAGSGSRRSGSVASMASSTGSAAGPMSRGSSCSALSSTWSALRTPTPVQKTCHRCGEDLGEAGPAVTARIDSHHHNPQGRMAPFCTARCHRLWVDSSTCRGCGRSVPQGFAVKVRTTTPLPGDGASGNPGLGALAAGQAALPPPPPLTRIAGYCSADCAQKSRQLDKPRLEREGDQVLMYSGGRTVADARARTSAKAAARSRLTRSQIPLGPLPPDSRSSNRGGGGGGGRGWGSGGIGTGTSGGIGAGTSGGIGAGTSGKAPGQRRAQQKGGGKGSSKAKTKSAMASQEPPTRAAAHVLSQEEPPQQQQTQESGGKRHDHHDHHDAHHHLWGGSASEVVVISPRPPAIAVESARDRPSIEAPPSQPQAFVTLPPSRRQDHQQSSPRALSSASARPPSSCPSFSSFQSFVPTANRGHHHPAAAAASASSAAASTTSSSALHAPRANIAANARWVARRRTGGSAAASDAGAVSVSASAPASASAARAASARAVSAGVPNFSPLPPTPAPVLENQHRPLERLVNPLDSIGRPVPGKRPLSVASTTSDPFRVTKRFHRSKDDVTEHTESVQRLDRLMKEAEAIGRKNMTGKK